MYRLQMLVWFMPNNDNVMLCLYSTWWTRSHATNSCHFVFVPPGGDYRRRLHGGFRFTRA